MLNPITNRYTVRRDLREYIAEAERMIEAYGWEESEVYPYQFPMKVTKIIADLKDYDICTEGSQEYLIDMANGLARILNIWEEQEKEPKVTVRLNNSGKLVQIRESSLDLFEGLCTVVAEPGR